MSDDNHQAVISDADWLAIEKILSRNAGQLRELNDLLKHDQGSPSKLLADEAIRLHQQAAKAYNQGHPSAKLATKSQAATAAAWEAFDAKHKVNSQPVADKPPLDETKRDQPEAVEPEPELDSGSASQSKPAESDDTKPEPSKVLPYVIVCLVMGTLAAGISMLLLHFVYGVSGITLAVIPLGVSLLAIGFFAWILRPNKPKLDRSSTDHAA